MPFWIVSTILGWHSREPREDGQIAAVLGPLEHGEFITCIILSLINWFLNAFMNKCYTHTQIHCCVMCWIHTGFVSET